MATTTVMTRARTRSVIREEPPQAQTSTPAARTQSVDPFVVHGRLSPIQKDPSLQEEDDNSYDGEEQISQMTRGELAETEDALLQQIEEEERKREMERDYWEARVRIADQIKRLDQLKKEAADRNESVKGFKKTLGTQSKGKQPLRTPRNDGTGEPSKRPSEADSQRGRTHSRRNPFPRRDPSEPSHHSSDDDEEDDDSDYPGDPHGSPPRNHRRRRPQIDPMQMANIIRTPPPARFDPRKDMPIMEWLFKMNQWFTASGIPMENRVSQAAMLLDGYAFTWWMTLDSEDRIPQTWGQFYTDITQQFATIDASRKARDQLQRLEQKTSVAEYDKKFMELVFQITDISDSEMFHKFRSGLKAQIRNKMDELGIDTDLRALKQAAMRYDDLTFYQRSSGQGSSFKKQYRGSNQRKVQEVEGKPRDLSNVTCYNCNKKGHLKKDCKAKLKQGANKGPIKNETNLNMVSVDIKKVDKNATIPEYKTKEAAGADLKPSITGTI